VTPELDLYDRDWPIWTYAELKPPAKFVHDEDGRRGMAVSSLVSGDCIVSGASLITQTHRADLEKLQLRLAIGAAESRLYVSFPTVEVGDGRPRVPSLYALEVWRAMTGRVPSADELQQVASRASHATLAWPAPADREEAIDALEHDLATLRGLVGEPDHRARGRAHYMLQLNDCLQRSVRERYMRGKRTWSRWDGIVVMTDRLKPVLDAYRLGAVGGAGLADGRGQVVADGPRGEVHASGDDRDGRAVGRGAEHVGLALGQRRVADGQAVHGQRRVDDAEALVDPAYGVGELRGRRVLDDETVGARLHGPT